MSQLIEVKQPWWSKTIWLNLLTCAVWGAGQAAGILSAFPLLVTALVLVNIFGNIIVRFFTKSALIWKKD